MRCAVFGIAFASLLLARTAAADPQWNVSWVTGAAGVGDSDDHWQDTRWYNGIRGDVLFGRQRNADIGLGPYVSASTAGFDDARLGGGGSMQLPIHAYLPLVLSAGAYGRHDGDWHPGAAAWLFWGSRSFNFHSSYVMTGGLLVGFEQDVDDQRQNAWMIGAQIDGLVLVLPFILGYEWIKGSPEDD